MALGSQVWKSQRSGAPFGGLRLANVAYMWVTHSLTYLLHGAQQNIWETNRFSASQETSQILWNPKVHYRVYKSPPPVLILSQINPVHVSYPTSWRFILILSSHLRQDLPSGLFPSGFRTKILYAPFLSPLPLCHIPRPSHSSEFDYPHNVCVTRHRNA